MFTKCGSTVSHMVSCKVTLLRALTVRSLSLKRWEVSFFRANGYEALNFMLWEIVSSTKR